MKDHGKGASECANRGLRGIAYSLLLRMILVVGVVVGAAVVSAVVRACISAHVRVSALRARLAAGERCENELPPLVRRVIQREGLYRETKGDEDRNDSETGKRACAQPAE